MNTYTKFKINTSKEETILIKIFDNKTILKSTKTLKTTTLKGKHWLFL